MARVGFEPAILRLLGKNLTITPPRPQYAKFELIGRNQDEIFLQVGFFKRKQPEFYPEHSANVVKANESDEKQEDHDSGESL